MWTTQHTAETDVTPSAVWAALVELHSGTPLGPNSDSFELHGPLAVGTQISITPQGQETMQSVIVELEQERVYADLTEFQGLRLLFRHTLTPTTAGGTRVTHELEIHGDDADQVGPDIGPQISADFPVAMGELIAAASRR
jgi:hypothetical protein